MNLRLFEVTRIKQHTSGGTEFRLDVWKFSRWHFTLKWWKGK